MCQVSEDYADTFCELFDGIDAADFRANGESWLLDRKLQAVAAEVEAAALAGERIEVRHPFAALLGLDAALAGANPLLGGPAPAAISEYALRYAESGRFDSGTGSGALLPRFAPPRSPRPAARGPGRRVRRRRARRQADWDACDHAIVPSHARLTRRDRETGLRVARRP